MVVEIRSCIKCVVPIMNILEKKKKTESKE